MVFAFTPARGVFDELGFSEHTQVPADRRAADRELGCQRTGLDRVLLEQLQNTAPNWVGQGVRDGVHSKHVTNLLLIGKA